MNPSISPAALAARVGSDTRHARIVNVLCAAFPDNISAPNLMVRAGLPFHSNPVGAFIELCISVSHINSRLPHRVGWEIDRTDGTPQGLYRLSPAMGGRGGAA